jgi:hypothetical protein
MASRQEHSFANNPRTVLSNSTLRFAKTIACEYRSELGISEVEAELFFMWLVKGKTKLLGGVYYLSFKLNLTGKNPVLVDVRRGWINDGKGFFCQGSRIRQPTKAFGFGS